MKIAAVLTAVVLAAAGGCLFWMGAFAPVRVTEQERGPYSFVYVQDPGTDKIGEMIEGLAARLDEAGFSNRMPAELLYPVGRGVQNQIGFMVDRPVLKEVLGADTFFRILPMQRYASASFPHRNALSYVLAAQRLTGALQDYRKSKGVPDSSTLVITDGGHIHWLQPLEQP